MGKLYTRNGDEGFTRNYLGKKIAKDDLEIIVQGRIDSLQSSIDLVMLDAKGKTKEFLEEIQKKLWQTAGEISCADKSYLISPVAEEDIKALEDFTDSLGEPPRKFIRFNTLSSAQYNEARVRCRELEIYLTKLLRNKRINPVTYRYVNRLSSSLFMLAFRETK